MPQLEEFAPARMRVRADEGEEEIRFYGQSFGCMNLDVSPRPLKGMFERLHRHADVNPRKAAPRPVSLIIDHDLRPMASCDGMAADRSQPPVDHMTLGEENDFCIIRRRHDAMSTDPVQRGKMLKLIDGEIVVWRGSYPG